MINHTPQLEVVVASIIVDSLASVIASEYDFGGPITCTLMKLFINDHYLITDGQNKYVARLYRNILPSATKESDDFGHPRAALSYAFELELVNHLFKMGLPVSYSIQRRDGEYLGPIDTPEGVRYYALFTFAEGKISVPMSEEQSYLHGAGIGRIHLATNSYQSKHQRYASDLTFLLDDPIQRLREYWGESRGEKLDLVVDLTTHLKEKIFTLLNKSPDSWHIIGGNFTSTHTFFNEQNQPTYFDFDSCSYGWRAYDLAIFLLEATLMGAAPEISASFLAGYQSVRPLSEAELDSLLPFMLIRQIWIMGTLTLLADIFGHLWFKAFYEQKMGELNMLWAYYQAEIGDVRFSIGD